MIETTKPANTGTSAPKWELDSVFAGGSKSEDFRRYRETLKLELAELGKKSERITSRPDPISREDLIELILAIQGLYDKVNLVYSFSGCLASQDVKDDLAFQIHGEAQLFLSQWENLKINLEALILKITDADWGTLLTDTRLQRIRFFLDELRTIAKSKMSPVLESLATDLAVNGYHAWNMIYTKMAGNKVAEFTEDGTTTMLSLGQLALKTSSPRREIRKQAFEKITQTWEKQADLAAMMLNAQAGFRLSWYRHRNWKSALYEPLLLGRLKEETLEAMWAAVLETSPGLQKFVTAKQKYLQLSKFCWYDQNAPVGQASKAYSFDKASHFIVEHLAGFSQEMSYFSRMVLDKRWVEAENRAGKAAGGYCTGLGEIKESRIFMTYEDNYDSLLTLAHELGHAYHHQIVQNEPAFARFYTLGLAETASTFNELLVTDAALESAVDPQEKIMLLDQKLTNAFIMFCNIHCRYLFDREFYREREHGIVCKDRLNEIMLAAQQKAYCGMLDPLDGYHPLFWASKLHFFETQAPFYNFPYTFGFLFSNSVYQRAKAHGPAFAKDYCALLADTGVMTSEEIARKHLGVDLTDPAYWKETAQQCIADIDRFVRLLENNP